MVAVISQDKHATQPNHRTSGWPRRFALLPTRSRSGPVLACETDAMNQNKTIEWLHDQLPVLVTMNILSAESAEALRRHYPLRGRKSGLPFALLFFGAPKAL